MSHPSPMPTESRIAEAAYYLWLDAGCPAGRDADHWTAAEAALLAVPPKPKRKRAAAARSAPKAKAGAAAGKSAAKPKAKRKTAKARPAET